MTKVIEIREFYHTALAKDLHIINMHEEARSRRSVLMFRSGRIGTIGSFKYEDEYISNWKCERDVQAKAATAIREGYTTGASLLTNRVEDLNVKAFNRYGIRNASWLDIDAAFLRMHAWLTDPRIAQLTEEPPYVPSSDLERSELFGSW